MRFHRRKQQVPITRPLVIPFVVGDDLVLRFLQLDQLAELVGLARLSFAYDFRVRFEQTDQFVRPKAQAGESAISLVDGKSKRIRPSTRYHQPHKPSPWYPP